VNEPQRYEKGWNPKPLPLAEAQIMLDEKEAANRPKRRKTEVEREGNLGQKALADKSKSDKAHQHNRDLKEVRQQRHKR
jgi:hypothetical protein